MQFELKTDLAKGLQVIDFNFEAIKAELSERMAIYKGVFVSPDGVKAAKEDRAKLNAFKSALDDARKNVKKQYLQPYEAFEARMKELLALVDAPIQAIDTQVKAYEQAAADEKKAAIEQFFGENIGDLKGILSLDRIFDQRWLNASYKLKNIQTEIMETTKKLRDNIRIIQVMKLDFEQEVLNVLISTLDMGAALARKNELEAQAERLKAMTVPVVEKPATSPQKAPVQTEIVAAPASKPTDAEDLVEQIDFRVWVTAAQKAALRQFFIDNGIKYGKVPA